MLKDVLVVLQRTAGALTCAHPLTWWTQLWHLLFKLWCCKHTNSVCHILACQLAAEKMRGKWNNFQVQCSCLHNDILFDDILFNSNVAFERIVCVFNFYIAKFVCSWLSESTSPPSSRLGCSHRPVSPLSRGSDWGRIVVRCCNFLPRQSEHKEHNKQPFIFMHSIFTFEVKIFINIWKECVNSLHC